VAESETRVVSSERESHVFFFEISFFFFLVCGQLNFSRVSQNFITVVCF
jgi:hypothetical protein